VGMGLVWFLSTVGHMVSSRVVGVAVDGRDLN